jgi:threonyl-tRNA synthetase
VQIFKDDVRSWRDLPVRYAEFGSCHRDEPSGSMHGLLRTRAFEQDDAHVLCAPEHVDGEVARFVDLLRGIYSDLGFERVSVALSLRPRVRAGSDEDWDRAEAQLLSAARSCGLEPELLPGEGAFYGPKLEFALQDRQGRSWQCGTAQLDMVLPGRLGAQYVDRDGERVVPVMIHHAVLGSLGRFIGILLEEHEGRLPFWLSPDQVAVIPVSEAQRDYAAAVRDDLLSADLRPVLLDQSETFSKRLVMSRERMIPAVMIIGAREMEAGSVAIKEGGSQYECSRQEAVALLAERRGPT